MPPASLKRFFTEEGSSYRVKNSIREMLVFAKHNLIRDAALLQAGPRLLPQRPDLHGHDPAKEADPHVPLHAQSGRVLFLGESESIGTFADLFAPVDARHKIFRRKPAEIGYEPRTADLGFYPQSGDDP